MSAPQSGTNNSSSKPDSKVTEAPQDPQKQAAVLEEDDEFEDFPVEGMNPGILLVEKVNMCLR